MQGPSASGLGAVQQFFEALGLTPAPKVNISDRQLALKGNPGAPMRCVLKVETQEKRPVYAHGTSNQPWLEVGRANLTGRTATIGLSIPAVPNRPGETLTAPGRGAVERQSAARRAGHAAYQRPDERTAYDARHEPRRSAGSGDSVEAAEPTVLTVQAVEPVLSRRGGSCSRAHTDHAGRRF